MMRPLSHSALGLTVVFAMTACQGNDPQEQEEAAPSPVPVAELETVSLPGSPKELADRVTERMQEALSVEVEISVEPEGDEETGSLEDVSMTLLLTDPPAAQMTVVDHEEDRPSTAHIVVEDEVMYAKLEEEPILGDKEWMRISQEKIDQAEEESGPFAEIFQVMLKETNNFLAEASGESSLDVVRLGELDAEPETEDSDDGELTRYKGTTSTHDLADAEHEEFEQVAEQGLDEVIWEIAVTDKALPSEFTVQLLTPDGERAESTVRYSDWGPT
ncbi:hypothetical protein [Allosalinactinospora lopnorensis]|uniref:hypothetical protein n=1 Tax=Allosalinactinospora lopnorensis TaxID=1352348 RepID=UPI001F45C619|nr:hypothetical protein [Allosalinactinospora lopnorensis]